MDLLERDGAMAELAASIDRLVAGTGGIVTIRGEAGIGKTSVARAVSRLAEATAVEVWWGNCDDLLTPQILAPVWDVADGEPILLEPLKRGSILELYRTMSQLINERRTPTLLVLEDVHNADSATLDLIKIIGRRIERLSALVVITFRPDAAGDHPLWILVGDLPADHTRDITLDPFTFDAVASLAGSERARRVWELTDGNPLLVRELVAADQGTTPPSVHDMVKARMHRLHPVARRLTELVSVVPGGTDVAVIAQIDPGLMEAVADAEASGLLERDHDALVFRHELLRTAVEAVLTATERRERHGAVLKAAEALGLDVAVRAHHARGAVDLEAMVRLLPEAATAAAKVGSNREANDHLRALAAVDHLLEPEDRADFYDRWAAMELAVSGDALVQAQRAVALRRGFGDANALVRSLLLASRAASYGSDSVTAAELASEAFALAEPLGGEPLAAAYAERSRLAMMNVDLDAAIHLAHQALIHAGPASEARANALTNIGCSTAITSFPDGIDELEQSIAISHSRGYELEMYRALENLVDQCIGWYDLGRAEQVVSRFVWHDEERASLTNGLQVRIIRLHEVRGRLEHAFERGLDLLDAAELQPVDRLVLTMECAELSVMLGRPDCDDWVAAAWDLVDENPELQHLAQMAEVESMLSLYRGSSDDTATVRSVATLERLCAAGDGWSVARTALWLWLAGRIDEIPPSAAAPVGWIGSGEWRRAAQWFGERGAVFEQCVALGTGDIDARRHAVSLLEDLGARPHASLLRRSLRADGAAAVPGPRRRSTAGNALGLTSRQQQVMTLLVEGLSNAAIAEKLFISVRTVEKHVAAVLARLGVSSRHDVADAVDRSTPIRSP